MKVPRIAIVLFASGLLGSLAAAVPSASAATAGPPAGQSVSGITTSIAGFPASARAGGGPVTFTVTVTNHTRVSYPSVAPLFQVTAGQCDCASGRLLRYYPAAHAWRPAPMPDRVINPLAKASGGVRLPAHGSFAITYRLYLGGKNPAGHAEATAVAVQLPLHRQLGVVTQTGFALRSRRHGARPGPRPANTPNCSPSASCVAQWALSQVTSPAQGPCGNGGAGYFATGSQQHNSCNGQEWCADFAGWAFQQGGALSLGPLTDGVSSFSSTNYDPNTGGNWPGYAPLQAGSNFVPSPGDAVLFGPYTASSDFLQHIAIVTWSNGDTLGSGTSQIQVVGGNEGGGAGIVQHDGTVSGSVGSSGYGQPIYGYVMPILPNAAAPTAPAAGTDSSFNVYTFWKGTDGNLYEDNRTGSGTWSGQHMIAGMGPLGSQPTVAVTSAGNQYVFWEGTNGWLFEASYYDGNWHGPNKVTDSGGNAMGPMGSPPTAGVDGSGNVYVFWTNAADQGLEETSGLGFQPGSFHAQHEIFVNGNGMGPLGSAPAVAVGSTGNQYVFWAGRGSASHLYEAYWNNANGWHGPDKVFDSGGSALGPLGSAPGAGIDSSGNEYVFWTNSTDQGLEETTWNGTHFTPQHEIFISGVSVGPLGSGPAVAVDSIGNQLVFWHGATNSSMWEVNYDGSWHGPADRNVGPLA